MTAGRFGSKLPAMSDGVIKGWLETKQRKTLLSARWYFLLTAIGGTIALSLNLGIAYIFIRIVLLLAAPVAIHTGTLAWILATPVVVLLFVDCRRAERDDMTIIPLWLAREYFHTGPRLILEGWRSLERARQLSRIDVEACAEILTFLVSKSTPTSRQEFMRTFSGLGWDEMAAQLRLIDGLILFRSGDQISLLAPLRLELRRLLNEAPRQQEYHQEEPEAVPVSEPQRLSPREILGVSATASAAEIKSAYRNRMKECHPDRFANMDEQSRYLAEEWTKALNAAYEELVGQRNGRRS